MPGSSFGTIFKVTTFGESHGRAVGVIVEGVPPNIEICEAEIQVDMDRRRPGQSKVSTPRKESDKIEIVSGVFDGKTMGPPVTLMIRNNNQEPSAYLDIKHKFRPGHADFSYFTKYGLRDWRGSGRASGRETAARVAAGSVAKKVLQHYGVSVVGFSREIAGIKAKSVDYDIIETPENIVRTPDLSVMDEMIERIQAAQKDENSVGGVVEVHVRNCPPGLGDPVFDKLEAKLAHGVMSIGAIKGFEVGIGFDCVGMFGHEFNDEFYMEDGRIRTKSNNSGGINGGISNGEDIIIRAAVRPPASIATEQDTVTVDKKDDTIEVHGRHDPCITPRAVPVVEAMVAITILDSLLFQEMYKQHRPSEEEMIEFMQKEWGGGSGNEQM
ncbi:MAG: chorismate synthase [Lentisphaeria bacterium]|nr:chorismate synthase [Lentisphaeria bacterium]